MKPDLATNSNQGKKMKRVACLSVLVWFFLALIGAPHALAQTGDVQIMAAPQAGVRKRAAEVKGRAEARRDKLYFTNSIGMKFVLIPVGSFLMGSQFTEPERDPDEGPQHRVVISRPFFMQITEVTQAQYRAIMGTNPSHFQDCDRCPVEMVSWNDAQEFIRRLNACEGTNKYRLPTEVEWEYACRAGTQTPFYFGKTISPDQANYKATYAYENGRTGVYRRKTTPVGSFPPNRWGLYDMHGNVSEWCSDQYGEDYSTNSPTRGTRGPSSDIDRVLRGGSWHNVPRFLRSAFRGRRLPSSRYNNLGFRVFRIF